MGMDPINRGYQQWPVNLQLPVTNKQREDEGVIEGGYEIVQDQKLITEDKWSE